MLNNNSLPAAKYLLCSKQRLCIIATPLFMLMDEGIARLVLTLVLFCLLTVVYTIVWVIGFVSMQGQIMIIDDSLQIWFIRIMIKPLRGKLG